MFFFCRSANIQSQTAGFLQFGGSILVCIPTYFMYVSWAAVVGFEFFFGTGWDATNSFCLGLAVTQEIMKAWKRLCFVSFGLVAFGFQTFFIFTLTWGNDPIWRAYFSNGLVQSWLWCLFGRDKTQGLAAICWGGRSRLLVTSASQRFLQVLDPLPKASLELLGGRIAHNICNIYI